MFLVSKQPEIIRLMCVFVCVTDFHVGAPVATFDLRKVELTPLEQRKLTFDSHVMVTELESSGEETTRLKK